MKAVSLIVAVAVAVALLASVDAVDVARRQKLKTRMSEWKVARVRAAVKPAPKEGDACKVPYKGTGVCMKMNKCPTGTHAFEAGPKIPCPTAPASIGCCYIRDVKPAKPTPTKPVTPTPTKPTTPTTPTTPSVPPTPTAPVTPPSTPSTPASNSGSNAGSGSGSGASSGAGVYNPSNPLSVTRSGNPVKLVGAGNSYCSATWANARKKNNFWWNECINQFDAYSGGQKCVWSIEDEQCVSRSDQSNFGILQHALKYTAEFVSAHYAAAPVSYVILSDPLSVSTTVSSPNYAAGTIGICKDMRSWKSCLLSVDDQAPKQHCQWSIEHMMCVSALDKLNTKAVATSSAYPATFVRDHYYAAEPSSKQTPIPNPIPAPIGDLSNLKLVKRADKPIAMVGPGNSYCTATYSNARKKNNFLWNECITSFDAYSGGAKCVWSIEDHTCVSQTDNNNLGIVAHAVAYTPAYVAAYYAAYPVNYVILSDPLSVSTVVSSPNYQSGTNGNCKDMRSWKSCLLSVDEQSSANHCLWSIEYMMCVSSTDTVNTKVVAAAKQYPATFVRDHYYAAEPSSKQTPIPDPIPAPVGNADSKKTVGASAKPVALVGTGNSYCYNAKAQATKKNSFWWQECISTFDAYSGGAKCVWSIEDTQCVSQTDASNIGIVAHALAYTPSYITSYYAKNPMSYVNLADPKSVSTTGQPPVQASNSQCLLNKQYWSCLIAADELAPGKMCVWSIESGACVSVNDPKNAAVAATALKYTPEFVKAHYETK